MNTLEALKLDSVFLYKELQDVMNCFSFWEAREISHHLLFSIDIISIFSGSHKDFTFITLSTLAS